MRHIFKKEKFEIRAVIKISCKKGKSPKEIHEYLMETLGKVSLSYSTVINGQQSYRGGERALRMMGSLATPKMKLSMTCTPWL